MLKKNGIISEFLRVVLLPTEPDAKQTPKVEIHHKGLRLEGISMKFICIAAFSFCTSASFKSSLKYHRVNIR